jgi:hypothetical protein
MLSDADILLCCPDYDRHHLGNFLTAARRLHGNFISWELIAERPHKTFAITTKDGRPSKTFLITMANPPELRALGSYVASLADYQSVMWYFHGVIKILYRKHKLSTTLQTLRNQLIKVQKELDVQTEKNENIITTLKILLPELQDYTEDQLIEHSKYNPSAPYYVDNIKPLLKRRRRSI